MKKLLLIMLCLGFFAFSAYSENIAFEGTPISRTSSTSHGTESVQITEEKQINYKLVITKENYEFFWFSRERKKLKYIRSGVFSYFVSEDGSGYIKISKMEEGKYLYLEHMNLGLHTITYWGIGDRLDL
ncbi:hypothetical protein ACFL2J_02065 [Candidatus Omnitrophota bacterium]